MASCMDTRMCTPLHLCSFGSFEIFKPTDAVTGRSGPSVPHVGEMLPRMVDYVIRCAQRMLVPVGF